MKSSCLVGWMLFFFLVGILEMVRFFFMRTNVDLPFFNSRIYLTSLRSVHAFSRPTDPFTGNILQGFPFPLQRPTNRIRVVCISKFGWLRIVLQKLPFFFFFLLFWRQIFAETSTVNYSQDLATDALRYIYEGSRFNISILQAMLWDMAYRIVIWKI